jgi:tRNA (guanosine-2'-O-)-methyltransferase
MSTPKRATRRRHLDELSDEVVARMIEVLRPFVSHERQARIDRAIATRTRQVVVVLENLYDEHNASAVLRTAEAFGVHEVHVVEDQVRFVVNTKTSSGAYKWLDLHRHPSPRDAYQALRASGHRVWASSVKGDAVDLGAIDVSTPIALVFGNEHQGLAEQSIAAADGRFRVPMGGFVESLNVSVAAAVSLYDVLSRKRGREDIRLSEPEQQRLRAAWFALSVKAAKPLLAKAGLPFPVLKRQTTHWVEDPNTCLDGA